MFLLLFVQTEIIFRKSRSVPTTTADRHIIHHVIFFLFHFCCWHEQLSVCVCVRGVCMHCRSYVSSGPVAPGEIYEVPRMLGCSHDGRLIPPPRLPVSNTPLGSYLKSHTQKNKKQKHIYIHTYSTLLHACVHDQPLTLNVRAAYLHRTDSSSQTSRG